MLRTRINPAAMLNLKAHLGHHVHIMQYGHTIELECITCQETLQAERVQPKGGPILVDPPACELGSDCQSCGS